MNRINHVDEILEKEGPKALVAHTIGHIRQHVIDGIFSFLPPQYSIRVINLSITIQNHIYPKGYTDADPLKIIQVDPMDIQYHQKNSPKRLGRVLDGQWDLEYDSFEEHQTYKTLRQRFQDGRDWEDITRYQEMLSRIRDGNNPSGISSQSELDKHFSQLDHLYKCIKNDEYKTQRDMYNDGQKKLRDSSHSTVHPFLDEVAVNIHRDGKMEQTTSGAHRLSIAKLCGLEHIPVIVRTRHREWQKKRERLQNMDDLSNDSSLIISHPDLQDISKGTV